MHQRQTAKITWQENGIPRSTKFADPYFSTSGGLAEARHVFLAGNGLPQRLADEFHIAELGFGTGLNLLALWQMWRGLENRPQLHFTSFEAFPMHADDMQRALSHFPELSDMAEELMLNWRAGKQQFTLEGLEVEVIIGDARTCLPKWSHRADCWFLDGFSPAKNPELWGRDLLADVAAHSAEGATFATYSAAGQIRQILSEVGFEVTRSGGYGRKKHMSSGILKALR